MSTPSACQQFLQLANRDHWRRLLQPQHLKEVAMAVAETNQIRHAKEVCVLDHLGPSDFDRLRARASRKRWYEGCDSVTFNMNKNPLVASLPADAGQRVSPPCVRCRPSARRTPLPFDKKLAEWSLIRRALAAALL